LEGSAYILAGCATECGLFRDEQPGLDLETRKIKTALDLPVTGSTTSANRQRIEAFLE
jgi:hypothetical protein